MPSQLPAIVPKHIGFIMDGNRRWARTRNLPVIEGHRKGYETVDQVSTWCFERGIDMITLYAFSTENWQRSKQEVRDLFEFVKWVLTMDMKRFNEKGARLMVIGQLKTLSQLLQHKIRRAMELTRKNKKGVITIALNYGGREEIMEAVRQMIRQKVKASDVNEETIAKNLYTKGMSDPDLIIRTGGVQRLSNFLTWQSTYSELYFAKVLWPDFSEKDLDNALEDYANRKRNFGK
ncbi:MAG: polyprenyl diphosphate synthase [Patescibacteria group bacterium]|jgi:undecaprenyl diphosphate synthase